MLGYKKDFKLRFPTTVHEPLTTNPVVFFGRLLPTILEISKVVNCALYNRVNSQYISPTKDAYIIMSLSTTNAGCTLKQNYYDMFIDQPIH